MKLEDLIIASVDDHIVEPPTMFDQHLGVQHKAIKPELRKDGQGRDYWLFEGRRAGNIGLNAVVGRVREEYGCEPLGYDQMRKGAYDVHARIDDMNVNGILASLNFPSVATFDGGLFHQFHDKQAALTLLRAYNDWHVDEWCAAYPGRFIPLMLVPYWDIEATVAEVKRNVAKGVRAVTFSDNPSLKGQPSIHDKHWEPFWKVCAENDVVINIHIGSGAQAPHASMASPIEAWITTMPISIVNSAADWLNLQALHRYPNLKIALSEGGIGWIPYFLERADYVHAHHKAWTYSNFGGGKPSDLFKKHFVTCFIEDDFGLKNLDAIGEDRVCYECDYPHSDTLWPASCDRLFKSVQGLADATINKITHENALKLYGFDAFKMMGGRENCTVGALRRLAANVDTTEVAMGGPRPERGEQGPVTSEEVLKVLNAALEGWSDRLPQQHPDMKKEEAVVAE